MQVDITKEINDKTRTLKADLKIGHCKAVLVATNNQKTKGCKFFLETYPGSKNAANTSTALNAIVVLLNSVVLKAGAENKAIEAVRLSR